MFGILVRNSAGDVLIDEEHPLPRLIHVGTSPNPGWNSFGPTSNPVLVLLHSSSQRAFVRWLTVDGSGRFNGVDIERSGDPVTVYVYELG